jgi:hypothetical protein
MAGNHTKNPISTLKPMLYLKNTKQCDNMQVKSFLNTKTEKEF